MVQVVDQSQARILQLSDDVLLLILTQLPSPALLTLADTCLRLQSLCLRTESLWTQPDFSGHPMDLRAMRNCLKLFNRRTKSLTFEGFLKTKGRVVNISESFLAGIHSDTSVLKLRTLKLHNFYFHADKIVFSHFPRTLTHLSLSGCEVVLQKVPSEGS